MDGWAVAMEVGSGRASPVDGDVDASIKEITIFDTRQQAHGRAMPSAVRARTSLRYTLTPTRPLGLFVR